MEKYLDTLKKIKENEIYLKPQLKKIESYMKGESNTSDLLEVHPNIIYYAINKVLNYEEKDIHYYLELPNADYLCPSRDPAIIAGRIKEIYLLSNIVSVIDPDDRSKKKHKFQDGQYLEVTGDFSEIKDGIHLSYNEWYQILEKYPQLYEHFYHLMNYRPSHVVTMEEVRSHYGRLSHAFSIEDGDSSIFTNLINSIEFVERKEYITKEQAISLELPSFSELVEEKEEKMLVKRI